MVWGVGRVYYDGESYNHCTNGTGRDEHAVKYFADDTLEILGVAVVADTTRSSYHNPGSGSAYSNALYNVELHKPTGGSYMTTIATQDFDITHYDKLLHHFGFYGTAEIQTHEYFPVFETYFDTSYKVTDSFYVSFCVTPIQNTNDGFLSPLYLDEWHTAYTPDTQYFRIPWLACRFRSNPDEWCYRENPVMYYILPIVRWAGDTCPEVRELRYSVLARDGAFVQWGGHENHALYELSYGPVGTAPGEGTVVECAVPQRYLAGLERGVDYEVYVRARCDFARSEWTAWSDALLVEADSVASASVAGPEQGQRLFSVAPNPARGAATVTLTAEAAATGCSLTLRDEAGRIAMQRTVAAGTAAVELDLRGLEAGVYVITVKTGRGVESGKWKVESEK